MKVSCESCGVMVDLDWVQDVETEERDRTYHSSLQHRYLCLIWRCPCCKGKNTYNPEDYEERI